MCTFATEAAIPEVRRLASREEVSASTGSSRRVKKTWRLLGFLQLPAACKKKIAGGWVGGNNIEHVDGRSWLRGRGNSWWCKSRSDSTKLQLFRSYQQWSMAGFAHGSREALVGGVGPLSVAASAICLKRMFLSRKMMTCFETQNWSDSNDAFLGGMAKNIYRCKSRQIKNWMFERTCFWVGLVK